MPRYSYTGLTASGTRVTSTGEAPDLPALAARLAAEGTRIQNALDLASTVPRIRGVPQHEVVSIYRQISSSIEAGLPLVETLRLLASESSNADTRSVCYFVASQVAEGTPLSEAMSLFPDVFAGVHVAIVKAGEESGRLGPALGELADQAEAFANMNRRFASSLVYPTVVALAALAILSFGCFAVVPKMSLLFDDLGIRNYPLVTRVVLFLGGRLGPIIVLIALAVVILTALISAQRRAAAGRLWIDAWKLRIPALGQIIQKAALARFSGTLGMLLDAGVDLPTATRLASEAAGNWTVERLLKNASAEVELGRSLSESLERTGAMPSALAWRIGVGEETSSLPESLIGISRLYASQVDSLVTSLAGLLEPTLIIVLGTGIAMLVLGMFLPLAAVISSLCGMSGG